MRRVLIDECIPVQLYRALPGFDARTVAYMGWSSKSDVDLLAAATGQFDILLTGDQALPAEHDLARLGLVIVVVAETRRRAVERKLSSILSALHAAAAGTVTIVR